METGIPKVVGSSGNGKKSEIVQHRRILQSKKWKKARANKKKEQELGLKVTGSKRFAPTSSPP